jgi:hypothetical protein
MAKFLTIVFKNNILGSKPASFLKPGRFKAKKDFSEKLYVGADKALAYPP